MARRLSGVALQSVDDLVYYFARFAQVEEAISRTAKSERRPVDVQTDGGGSADAKDKRIRVPIRNKRPRLPRVGATNK
jgi:hypothetical protein